MTEIENLHTIWQSLGNSTAGWRLFTLQNFPNGNVLGGCFGPENLESVVFTFPDIQPLELRRLPAGFGFEVFPLVKPDLFSGVGIALCRKSEGNRELFHKMVGDVLELFTQLSTLQQQNERLVLSRIRAWQKFMQIDPEKRFTPEKEKGLWGELEFLGKMLSAGMAAEAALMAWRGPMDEPHDFQTGECHVEIKTSGNENGFEVQIGNLEQLTPSPDFRLYLCAFLLRTESEGRREGRTLVEQINHIRHHLHSQPESLARFTSLLLEAGFLDEDAGKYLTRYSLVQQKLFLVDETFPSLRVGTVPDAVVKARYSLDMNRINLTSLHLKEFCEGICHGIE